MHSYEARKSAGGLFAALLFAAGLPSILAAQEPFELPVKPQWNESAVYFFRDSRLTDATGHVCFYVNGIRVCDLLRDQYSCVCIPPGEYTITARQSIKSGPGT